MIKEIFNTVLLILLKEIHTIQSGTDDKGAKISFTTDSTDKDAPKR